MAKKILELCLSPDLGGLELFAYNCYVSFAQTTSVDFAVAKGSKLDNYCQEENKLYIPRSKFPLISAWKLAKYIDKNRIDILHFHWTKDILTVVLAKFFSRTKPKVVQSRHMRMTRFKDDFYHKWLYKNIDIMHAVTKEVQKQLEKFIPQDILPKIVTIYPGMKPKQRLDIANLQEQYDTLHTFSIVIVGRIEEAKGQSIVIEAVAELKELDVQLFIVGAAMKEEYLQELKTKVHSLGIDKKVVFTGFTKEVDKYMQLCDISIMATENETFGLVVIESMANETPVIAKNIGGPLEIIEDGVDGLFFDGRAADLAEKIKLLYDDRELLKKLQINGLKKIQEKFDYQIQLNKLYKVITDES